jgi:uncharacterized membrane protein YheB (UPF0754 family)
MGKIILEFDGIEEQEEAKLALNGVLWYSAMHELDQKLRSSIKHSIPLLHTSTLCTSTPIHPTDLQEIEEQVLERIREELHTILSQYELTL